MKDVLISFAEYNREANKKLVGILKAADAAALREDQGSYFKSVFSTLEHIAGGEIAWLKRFAGYFSYKCLTGHRFVTQDTDSIKNSIKDKPDTLFATLAEADELMAAMVKEVNEADLPKRVSYVNYKGETLERAYWNMIFHILNHATHHRGEISALLDRKGIANDYSGFNTYTK